ncbi:hypothetical protein B0T16DRAFT_214626 [Cercophora newfieldiana]|uniref:Uncharacterized protein n=1 Tax=Cercophora newfieldiana TaxID=92897 RepID=A0AA39XWB9_9PEZI|nr:hypothetical protein B0T16DRAFT_214626 [Cercophora newfieldiana]
MSESSAVQPEVWHIPSTRRVRMRKLFEFFKAPETTTGVSENTDATLQQLRRPDLRAPLGEPAAANSLSGENESPATRGVEIGRGSAASSHTSSDGTHNTGTSGTHISALSTIGGTHSSDSDRAKARSDTAEPLTVLLGPAALAIVYNIEGNIFVAKRGRVQIPTDALERFEREVKQRLINDLQEVREQFSSTTGSVFAFRRGLVDDSIYEPVEIRMSGRATGGENGQVTLRPTIWVRCPANCRRKMKKALRDPGLAWTKGTGFGKIMVADSANLLAARGTPGQASTPGLPSLGLALGAGLTLFLHIGIDSRTRSANGLICQSTLRRDGNVEDEVLNYSRLGGIIFLDGQPVGITSAHRILNTAWGALMPARDGRPGTSSDRSRIHETDSEWTDRESMVGVDYHCYDAYRLRPPLPDPVSSQPERLVVVSLGQAANLAGIKLNVMPHSTSCSIVADKTAASDFALIDLYEHGYNLVNEYRDEDGLRIQVQNTISSINLDPGPVKILLNPIVDAVLLEDSTSLEIGGTSLSTRLLQLENPLAQGCSGSWVVRGSSFCGMIIAGYGNEPYTHMIPADQLLSHIKSSLPEVKSVEVWAHPPAPGSESAKTLSVLPQSGRDGMASTYGHSHSASKFGPLRSGANL